MTRFILRCLSIDFPRSVKGRLRTSRPITNVIRRIRHVFWSSRISLSPKSFFPSFSVSPRAKYYLVGFGALVACGIFICYDIVLQRAKKAKAPWSSVEEYRRLPLACFGGPLYVVSLFWLGWTADSQVHWAIPLMAGLPFGIGFVLIFMALLNYLGDAYEIFAASAMAASSFTRSIFGAVLPFAGLPMYRKLGIPWATSLLGFLSLAMTIVPFAFIKYGDRIRAGSKFCHELKERKREMEARAQKISSADGAYTLEVIENDLEGKRQGVTPIV